MIDLFFEFWSMPDAARKCISRIDSAVTTRESQIRSSIDSKEFPGDFGTAHLKQELNTLVTEVRSSSNTFATRLRALHSKPKPSKDDWFFGFHAMPDASVGHLHMHVLPLDLEGEGEASFRRWSTEKHDWKTVPAQAVVELLQESEKGEKGGA